MGMMAKMRSSAPWFILTVGGLFVLFMILSDSQLGNIVGQRSNNVGTINGEDITYQEFSNIVEQYRRQQQTQSGRDIEENQMPALRDQVWETLVSQKLISDKIDEFGIIVTDEEIREMILGPNPPAYLQQSFIDSTGQFNRGLYESAIFDPRNKEVLIQAEENIRQQKIQEKLQSYLNASVTVSESELLQAYMDNNLKMSADYALVDNNTIADEEITITDNDLSAYYNAHKEDYKTKAQRKIKYILLKKEAAKADTIDIQKNLEAIIGDLQTDTSGFKTMVEIYSDQPYKVDTTAFAQIPSEAIDKLQAASNGDIVGPVLTREGFIVYKLINKFRSNEQYVKASHILLKTQGVEDVDAVKKKADDLYKQLRNGADFEAMAKEFSDDPGSGSAGGNLGWFGKGQMVKAFEDACFRGREGVVQRPVKTNFGYHIIKVTGKSRQNFVYEKIINKIEASASTLGQLQDDAADFAYLADENGFDEAAEMLKYTPQETPLFIEDAFSIPGLGANKSLIKFAFENSIGDISQVYYLQNGYVVAMPTEATEEGFRSLEDSKAAIENAVKNEKKLEKTKEYASAVRAKIGSSEDLNVGKEAYDKLKVASANTFTTNGNVPGVGREFAFSEYAAQAEINKVSEPIVGKRGTFIIKLKTRIDFSQAAFDLQKITLKGSLLQQKRAQNFSTWLANLKVEADIEDNRHQFYR